MENTKTTFRPILFSTPMVQALLEGRKTMTRRTKGLEKFNEAPDSWRYDGYDKPSKTHYMELISSDGKFTEKYFEVVCPYQVGDVFWVRENYYTASNWDHWKPSALKLVNVEVFYVADLPNYDIPCPLSRGKIRPCIFLPKEYARIFLKIKSIRVERLQDISEEDAKKEGIKVIEMDEAYFDYQFNGKNGSFANAKGSFSSLWILINGEESWNQNPFVFVYEFEQIEKHLDFIL